MGPGLHNRFSGLVAIQARTHAGHRSVYGVIRHPSYLGKLVNSFGWGLAFRSGIGVLFTAMPTIPLIVRLCAEERLLLRHFGDTHASRMFWGSLSPS
ncbi:MAG: methyltransferase [Bryobacteraceae bacterium]